MITISTRCYTTEQLKDLAEGYFTRLTEYLIVRNVKNIQIARRTVKPTQYAVI